MEKFSGGFYYLSHQLGRTVVNRCCFIDLQILAAVKTPRIDIHLCSESGAIRFVPVCLDANVKLQAVVCAVGHDVLDGFAAVPPLALGVLLDFLVDVFA